MKLRYLLAIFILLIHLQVTAGELINIKGVVTLKPIVELELTTKQVKYLYKNGPDKGSDFLTLHMLIDGQPADIAVAGRYTLSKKTLSYTPLYPLGHDTYFEVHYTRNSKKAFTKEFKTPANNFKGKIPKVVTAYPLADTIPYNTLYFHVRFSHAMKYNKLAYKHVRLYDEDGNERKNAWRQQSAWADDGKLLVLMIHPGRVKNGIHYESPMFDSGKVYTLKVQTGILDINGNTIDKEYTQKFYISGVDRVSPKPLFNKIDIPIKGTIQPIILPFSEGMDNASVLDGIRMVNAHGSIVKCTIRENNIDREYTITPNSIWQSGSYTLTLKSTVYDFSANRINRLFEISDVAEIEKDKLDTIWTFEVR